VWSGIWGLLSSLPKLLALFKEGISALGRWFKSMADKRDLEKFDAGAAKAKATKDTSDLENLFGNREPPKPKSPGE
jgi:hypothetical protein